MWGSLLVTLHTAVVLAVVVRVLIRPRLDPSVRLAWIMVAQALPVAGILAYVLFGEVRLNRAEVQRMADVRDRLTRLNGADDDATAEPPHFALPVVAANAAVGGFPALADNRIHLLEEGDGAIDRLVDAIDGAASHVHILFYIWLPDHSGRKVAEAVVRAAGRGVRCRVIVDALGSRGLVRSSLWSAMSAAGAECVTAFPWGLPFISVLFRRLDLRNHRKIVVIDNGTAFSGSRNCADMAFAVKPRFAPWIDILMSIEGPVVRQFQAVFLADWMSYTGQDLGDMLESVAPIPPEDPNDGEIAQVIPTGPDRRQGSISDCLSGMLHTARDRVVISTPYYVPDAALDAAIRAAARRGVDVTLILPERNDSVFVGATSQGFYYGLLAAGARVMLFRHGLLHSKIMTVDSRMAMVGSANLDRRSFDLNYEVNMAVFDREFVAELDVRQVSYLARSREITLDEVRGWGVLRRMRNNLLALASPLL